ncbi:hypothetical protein [Spirosoma aerophilum]
MKTLIFLSSLLFGRLVMLPAQAQSTTGGRSGGSTASTGTGYLTEGKRPAETSASSMTIADEGASRDYMYVPATKPKNRTTSPDGSGSSATSPQKMTPEKKATGSKKSQKNQRSQ